MERWRGRVAVVTGAGSGIGAAIAYQLQDAGLTVVALDIRDENIPGAVESARKDAETRGRSSTGKAPSPGELHRLKCDVSKEEDVLSAFSWVRDNVGGVDILVNNAGRGGDTQLLETNTSEWQALFAINVLGLSMCTREAIKLMREKGIEDGHIVHICSTCGHSTPFIDGYSMYFATKNAVRVLTEGLRKELVAAKSRIRVSEISPGVVKTKFMESLTHKRVDLNKYPNLNPEDVADAVLYVLSVPSHVQVHSIVVRPLLEEF